MSLSIKEETNTPRSSVSASVPPGVEITAAVPLGEIAMNADEAEAYMDYEQEIADAEAEDDVFEFQNDQEGNLFFLKKMI